MTRLCIPTPLHPPRLSVRSAPKRRFNVLIHPAKFLSMPSHPPHTLRPQCPLHPFSQENSHFLKPKFGKIHSWYMTYVCQSYLTNLLEDKVSLPSLFLILF